MHFTRITEVVVGLVVAVTTTGVTATAIPRNDDGDFVAPHGQGNGGHDHRKSCWCYERNPLFFPPNGSAPANPKPTSHTCCHDAVKPLGHRCPALGHDEQETFIACCGHFGLGGVCPMEG